MYMQKHVFAVFKLTNSVQVGKAARKTQKRFLVTLVLIRVFINSISDIQLRAEEISFSFFG